MEACNPTTSLKSSKRQKKSKKRLPFNTKTEHLIGADVNVDETIWAWVLFSSNLKCNKVLHITSTKHSIKSSDHQFLYAQTNVMLPKGQKMLTISWALFIISSEWCSFADFTFLTYLLLISLSFSFALSCSIFALRARLSLCSLVTLVNKAITCLNCNYGCYKSLVNLPTEGNIKSC